MENNYRVISVQIKYLVNLADKAGRLSETAGFPSGSTLESVQKYLQQMYDIKLPDPGIMTVLNGRGWNQHPEKMNTPLADGDTILLFPPIAGG